MLIRNSASGFNHPLSSEITSEGTYQRRRDLIKLMATGVTGAALAGWAGREAVRRDTEVLPAATE